MSDPFERLGSVGGSAEPPLDAIKARARRIQRRRYAGVAGGAVAIALFAVVGIVVSSGPDSDPSARRLAQGLESKRAAESPTAAPRRELDKTTSAEAGGAAAVVPQRDAPEGASTFSSGGEAAPAAAAAESQAAADRSATGMEVSLDVIEESAQPRRGVGLLLKACNRSGKPIDLDFSTGQRYDFEVSQNGDIVWRWSDGMSFTQVFGQERWDSGECKTYSEWWDGTDSQGGIAPPGSYQAVGILTSSPSLRTGAETFCLDAC